jgi:outer membrane receptor protein involved in Fe transport
MSAYLKHLITATVLLGTSLITFQASAQMINGHITDAVTGEPMTGATIHLKESGNTTYAQLDGKFSFKNLKPGHYSVEVSYINYKAFSEEISVNANKTSSIEIKLEPKADEMTGVVVATSGSGSEKNTRTLEKNSNQLVNIVSSRTMELSPDITVANVLQRVSGVTIERNSAGEGRYPIIRGMDKRYINTLVNGIKIPSPDNKSRFIPLDLFPSEILQRLEVSKSLTPSMEGDAIGGTINLVMKDAPVEKLLQANVSIGYNNIFNDQPFLYFDKSSMNKRSPNEINGPTYAAKESEFPLDHLNYSEKSHPINSTFGLTVGDRFGKNKKFGAILSGSYQSQYRGTKTSVYTTATTPNVDDIPAFEYLRDRKYSLYSQRLGLIGNLDYKINDRNKISLNNTFVKLNDFQVRQSIDTTNAINQTLSYASRTTWQYQSIYNSTLHGVHSLSSTAAVDWSAVYSIAKNSMPDQTSFSHGGLSVDRTGSKVELQGDDILSAMTRTWTKNSDKDLSFYLNFTKQTNLFKHAFELKIGGLYTDRHRDNFFNSYTLNPLRIAGANQLYTTVDNAQFTFNGSDPVAQLNGNNYTFSEDILAGYAQGKWKLSSKLEALGGARVENTKQNYNTELPPTANYKYGKITYTDILPSAQLKYSLDKNQAFRISYYRGIARPQFAELIPDGPADYELFKQIGNPQSLEHSVADNYDLRYEFFPASADQILMGVFYKRIQDPIELSVRKFGYNTQVLEPVNIGSSATNYGFEAVFTKYFGAFGISANYTFTNSSITNDSMLYKYRDPALGITDKYVSETRPLEGQAKHIANLSVLYKNPKIGLDAQVAFVYTGERLAQLNTYAGLHYWLEPTAQLDLSFEKRIMRKFSLYGKITNLTNTPIVWSIHQSYDVYLEKTNVPLAGQTDPAHKIIVEKDYFKTSFLFGFRYKL